MLEYRISGRFAPGDLAALRVRRLRVEPPRRTTLHRAWLDTADARLARRGLTLLHESEGARRRLSLAGTGEAVTLPAAAEPPRWPADLPAALRARLAELLDVRVLLPRASERGPAWVAAVVDGDEKTVARVWLQRLDGAPPADAGRVRVEPLRGYAAAAQAVGAALARDARLAPLQRPPLPPLVSGDGVRPARDVPARRAVALVLEHLLTAIEQNVDGTVGAWDTEFLHDLRVAVRRSRSAFKLAAPVLPAAFVTRFAPRLAWLGDVTTPARDLDVLREDLAAFARSLPAGAGADLQPVRALLEARAAAEYARLGRTLRSARFRQLVAGYRAAIGSLLAVGADGGADGGGDGGPAFGVAADGWADAALRKVVRRGRRIDAASPPEALHDLRKRAKELRYCLELFGSAWDPRRLQPFVAELKLLQDNLGRFQDSEVQRDALTRIAAELGAAGDAPTATVLLLGRLVAELEQRQAAAHAEFAERFGRFAGPTNLRRFARMTGGGG